MKVIEGSFGKQPPTDLAVRLRELADAAEKGEITSMVAAYIEGDSYSFMWAASLEKAVVLTALLQQRNYARMVADD
jgi:hypothetical protein